MKHTSTLQWLFGGGSWTAGRCRPQLACVDKHLKELRPFAHHSVPPAGTLPDEVWKTNIKTWRSENIYDLIYSGTYQRVG